MNAATAQLAQAEHRVKQRQHDLREIESELDRHQQQLERLAGVIEDQETIQAGYAQLQAAREADQQLGEKLQVMSAIKDRLNDTERRIQSARAELENQATAHRTRIESAERSAAELDALHADLADVRAEVERLEDQETHRDDLRETINALNEENAALQAENKSLYAEMQAIKTRIETVEAAEAVCPLCGQPLGEEHKTTLLEELRAEGTLRGDTYRANETRRKEIGNVIKTYRAEIGEIEAELERLLALRERAGKLEARAEESQSAADRIQVELSELRVIEGMLAGGEYAQELQAQRESIQDEIDSLGYDSDAHTAARETLTVYAEYDSRQRDLEVALMQVPEVEAALQNLEIRRERWITVLEEEQQEAAAAQVEIEALKEKVEEARRREEEVPRVSHQ